MERKQAGVDVTSGLPFGMRQTQISAATPNAPPEILRDVPQSLQAIAG